MILIDIDVPKWVLFFEPIIKELEKRGEKYILLSREDTGYSELNKLLKLKGFNFINAGGYGTTLKEKLLKSIERQKEILNIVEKFKIDKIIAIGPDTTRVGYGLNLPTIQFNDLPTKSYDNDYTKVTPISRLVIPFATKIFKPFVIPDEIFLHLGLAKNQIFTYNFIDPYLWIKDFKFDENYVKNFYKKYKIDRKKPTIVVREEEYKASYVDKKYPFLYRALPKIYKKYNANIIIIPRYESEYLKKEFPFAYIIDEKIYLQHLLKDIDLFIGAGGTINSESCFLGTPTISTRSFISHYDKWQIDNNLMVWVNNEENLLNYVNLALNNKLNPNIKALEKFEVNLEKIVDEILKV